MDIYQKALKNPDPPKKPTSTTTTPPSSTSTDYPTRLPPINYNNTNVNSMNYNYSPDNGSITGNTAITDTNTTTTTTNVSNENSNSNSSTNSPNSRPASTHTSEEIKNTVIKKKKNSRRKHRNSHLGCGTCKKRRIKCDETLPACLNCLKGKLHCAYLNLDNNARNALRVAQYNQTIRQEKLDANSSSSTANITNNTKLIDPLKGNILVQQQQQPGLVQSLGHGISIIPPHPSTSAGAAAAGSQNNPLMAAGPGSYPIAATVLPNNQTLVTAVPQSLQASMTMPPFANSILAPGIQANASPPISTTNLNSSITNSTSTTNTNTGTDITPSGSTSDNVQNIALAPQVVQSPYGPMIPLLTQTGSVVYAPTHSLVPAQPSQLTPQQLLNNVAFANATVPATGPLAPTLSQPSILPTTTATTHTTSPSIPTSVAPLTVSRTSTSSGIMTNVSPVLTNKQQPSSTPITSSAASVATIASQSIPVKTGNGTLSTTSAGSPTTATVSPPNIASILPPPINTLGNNSNGAGSNSGNDVFKQSVSDPPIKELKPINDSNSNSPSLPPLSSTTPATGNPSEGVKLSPNSSMTNLKKLTIKEDNNSGNDIKLPSITTLKRETSKSPSETNGAIDEKVPTISKLIT